jgi:hypothetical protein
MPLCDFLIRSVEPYFIFKFREMHFLQNYVKILLKIEAVKRHRKCYVMHIIQNIS